MVATWALCESLQKMERIERKIKILCIPFSTNLGDKQFHDGTKVQDLCMLVAFLWDKAEEPTAYMMNTRIGELQNIKQGFIHKCGG